MFQIEYYIVSFLIAVLAVVYVNILTGPGEVLEWLKRGLHNMLNDEQKLNDGEGYHPLYKMLVGCEKCFAGQVALWTYFIMHVDRYQSISFTLIFNHIMFISLTIFMTVIIQSIYKKLIE